MTPVESFQPVDLHFDGAQLTVLWGGARARDARVVDAIALDRLASHATAVAGAERHLSLMRDATAAGTAAPAGPGLEATQRELGTLLHELLDGPDRALTRRLEATRRDGGTLNLVVRLRADDRTLLAKHPALGWRLQLLTSADGPLVLSRDVTVAVQIGDAEIARPERLPGGRLQVLFMSYSPYDVEPVLDYEAEEDRILVELAPFIESHRLVLKVAEEGNLEDLKRRLTDRAYDVVHLTGHGAMTAQGPRLVMENRSGTRDDVSASRLLEALNDGRAMPRLLVISSCYSAAHHTNLPSFAAEMIQGGVPCVVGWTRPVLDTVATDAAEVLYRRLCSGDLPTAAVARARRELRRDDETRATPSHAWSTLELLATKVPGFAIDADEVPLRDTSSPGVTHRLLGSRMRILTEGFVGRRRELQVLGGILRRGQWARPGEREKPVAGALVVGMKGQGKSCLVGRAIDRYHQDSQDVSVVVLHGALDEIELIEAFRMEAVRLGDDATEAIITGPHRSTARRIERLLRQRWSARRLVIVLDDFEQNLTIPGVGDARLEPLAVELLEVLLSACRDGQPKLLITCTARFELAASLTGLLAELPLGALDDASVRKLWVRGSADDLSRVAPNQWTELCERLGRNPRILDWARQLLGGKTPEEIRQLTAAAGKKLPVWRDVLDEEAQKELVATFLRHMAFAEAQDQVGPDVMAFIDRARVYDVPVPAEAFAGLIAGLNVSLESHLAALANLGLLEIGSEDGVVYRVSPLVKPTFDAPDGPRWHAVAAEYWRQAAKRDDRSHQRALLQAWQHALAAKREDLADEAADLLRLWLEQRGTYAHSVELGRRHLAAFPTSVAGLHWTGQALARAGRPRDAHGLLEQALGLVASVPREAPRRAVVLESLASVFASLGEYAKAEQCFAELADQERRGHSEGSARLAAVLRSLADVCRAHGDLAGARAQLTQSLAILKRVLGTEDHAEVALSLHALALVHLAEGDLGTAEALLERTLAIQQRVFGTKVHPALAASNNSLARVQIARGDLAEALVRLEDSLATPQTAYGTDAHPNIAASLHEIGRVRAAHGDLDGARVCLERSLAIWQNVYDTSDHPAVAASLHTLASIRRALGDLGGARTLLEQALAIWPKVHGTEDHVSVAATLRELARVYLAQGDTIGACFHLERALQILRNVHGSDDHLASSDPKMRFLVEDSCAAL